MDVALYLIAAAVLIILIVFALKVRGKTQEGKEKKLGANRQLASASVSMVFVKVLRSREARHV